jgi:hypothetical protein
MEGIPKEPMPSALVQNTFSQWVKKLSQKIHKQSKFEEKVCDFVMQQFVDCNKV